MNMIKKYTGRSLWLAGLMLTTLIAGCSGGGSSGVVTDPVVTSDAPTVIGTAPERDAPNVAPNSTKVIVTFSEAMLADTITTDSFIVTGLNDAIIDGSVEYVEASNTAIFTADALSFRSDTDHTATVTAMATSAKGIPLAEYSWNFTTVTAPDAINPEVISNYPVKGSTDLFPRNYSVTAEFSETLDPASVDGQAFVLKPTAAGSTAVSGVVSYNNKVATFNPTANLGANTTYRATLTTGITDLAGNTLDTSNSLNEWTFTTSDTASIGPAAVDIQTAENFAIMTETGISSLGAPGSITGNIGVSPAAGSYITVACEQLAVGFEVYTVDATYPGYSCTAIDKLAASIAVGHVKEAYTSASAPATPAGVGPFLELGAGTVTEQTLVPGVYTWAGNVTITGDITLDGSADAVWIFQIDGTLDIGTKNAIKLAGGALAKNVFWRVADVVNLNTASQFKGIVLAKTNIAMIDGATIDGRLLAQTAVTLGTTTVVTQPAP